MTEIQQKKTIGVIGAGSFGTAIAELLAQKTKVIQYSRNPDLVASINENHYNTGLKRELPTNIIATNSLEEVYDARFIPVFVSIPYFNTWNKGV